MNPFRVAIVGAAKGPHMFDVIEIIGKEETIRRMEKLLQHYNGISITNKNLL